MNSNPRLRPFTNLLAAAAALCLPGALTAASLAPDHSTYVAGETISIRFSAGPGNARDWVGLYPEDATPGPTPSTRWYYVNNTQTAGVGVTEGTLTFDGGLNTAGNWKAVFLLNDGYEILAQTNFTVVDLGTTVVHTDKRDYQTGESIVVTFTNGPANPKDWIGLYTATATPGSASPSIRYLYTDGTAGGATGLTDGSVTFSGGLSTAGNYAVHFLLNDGYDILASEMFTVSEPTSSRPRLLSVQPTDTATRIPPEVHYALSLKNGTATVVLGSVSLKIDNAPVTPVVNQAGDVVTVSHTNATLYAPLSVHTYELTYRDTASATETFTNRVTFEVASYTNIVLPPPLVLETFDAVAEDALPAGWTQKSYTEALNADFDLANLDSASYARWTVIAASRLEGPMVGYSDPANPTTDYQRVLSLNPLVVLDGKTYGKPLATGRFAFSTSGYRNGRSQVDYLYSPDFSVTGKTNIYLSFHSLWEQNQDSMAAIEYSIDHGQSWLPVAYFLDGPDIYYTTNEMSGAVTVDAVTTFNATAGDIAMYTDDNGADQGGFYGAFIAAPVAEGLGPFVQARVNDDAVESKRIELYRLPAADNQAAVRLRFAHAGSDSWYFGIDDVGLYALPGAGVTPMISANRAGDQLTLQWPAEATGFVLQSSTSLAPGSWITVPGVSGNSFTVNAGAGTLFFRLRQ